MVTASPSHLKPHVSIAHPKTPFPQQNQQRYRPAIKVALRWSSQCSAALLCLVVSRPGLCCDILNDLSYWEHPLPALAQTASSLSMWGTSWSIRGEQELFIMAPRCREMTTFLEFRLAEMRGAGAAGLHPHREVLGR